MSEPGVLSLTTTRLIVGIASVLVLPVLFTLRPWRAGGEAVGSTGVGILAAVSCLSLFAGALWLLVGSRNSARNGSGQSMRGSRPKRGWLWMLVTISLLWLTGIAIAVVVLRPSDETVLSDGPGSNLFWRWHMKAGNMLDGDDSLSEGPTSPLREPPPGFRLVPRPPGYSRLVWTPYRELRVWNTAQWAFGPPLALWIGLYVLRWTVAGIRAITRAAKHSKHFTRRILIGVGAALLVSGWATTRYSEQFEESNLRSGAYLHPTTASQCVFLVGILGMALGAGFIGFAVLPTSRDQDTSARVPRD